MGRSKGIRVINELSSIFRQLWDVLWSSIETFNTCPYISQYSSFLKPVSYDEFKWIFSTHGASGLEKSLVLITKVGNGSLTNKGLSPEPNVRAVLQSLEDTDTIHYYIQMVVFIHDKTEYIIKENESGLFILH